MPSTKDTIKRDALPLLGYALLGLIHQKPSSGYDLRKVFAETAMGNYSSSPGAIYPALQRLEADGLLIGHVEETAGMRRRCVYRISKSGSAALKKWLARPVGLDEVKGGADELMLRFAFMEGVLGASACVDFLRNFGATLSTYIAELETFLEANQKLMPLSARLAFESGLRNYRCTHEWTEYAMRAFQDVEADHKQHNRSSKGGHV